MFHSVLWHWRLGGRKDISPIKKTGFTNPSSSVLEQVEDPRGSGLTQVIHLELECGPMPYAMAALTNVGGALCSTSQSLAEAQYWSAVQ